MSQPMSFGLAGLILGVIFRDQPVASKYIDLDFDGACLDSTASEGALNLEGRFSCADVSPAAQAGSRHQLHMHWLQ